MSEFTDSTIGRYLERQPGMRQALLEDPAQHMQVEALRRTLAMVDRALADEGVSEETRRRVANRVVWGEPEGVTDVHAHVREQAIAAYSNMSMPSPEALRAFQEGAGPVRPGEEPT
jgi:uncharacterized protein YjiS (DUF1127 family)